jgi:hypothetical protein
MKEYDKGWLVGIIDGEGSIRLNPRGSKGGWRRPNVSVVSTDQSIVERCREISGSGWICQHKKTNKKHKDQFEWILGTPATVELLQEIGHLLVVGQKRDRALFIVHHHFSKRNYTKEEREQKAEFEKRFYEL